LERATSTALQAFSLPWGNFATGRVNSATCGTRTGEALSGTKRKGESFKKGRNGLGIILIYEGERIPEKKLFSYLNRDPISEPLQKSSWMSFLPGFNNGIHLTKTAVLVPPERSGDRKEKFSSVPLV